MRPPSIVLFDRLFLASLAVSLISLALNYAAIAQQVTGAPGMAELGLGAGFFAGILVVSYAISVLLWFLVAHKASNVAKWILVV